VYVYTYVHGDGDGDDGDLALHIQPEQPPGHNLESIDSPNRLRMATLQYKSGISIRFIFNAGKCLLNTYTYTYRRAEDPRYSLHVLLI
jgi:hypothetical protein